MRYHYVRGLLGHFSVPRPIITTNIGRFSFSHFAVPIGSPPVLSASSAKLRLISCANFHSLPEPPLPPPPELLFNSLGEPSLSSLGLCSYWPAGWYQWGLEAIHVSFELPWWAAIAITTVTLRLCLFPFIVKQRRFLAVYSQRVPKLLQLQEQMTAARLACDYFEMMRISKELQRVSQEKLNLFDNFKVMFLQIPLFLAVFGGLRGMAAVPVESLCTGGLFWFTNLTVPDPYYLLPLLSMGSMLVMFECGVDIPKTQGLMRNFMRSLPVIGFLFVMNMPAALLWHWSISNIISLLQALLLRTPKIRHWLQLPDVPSRPPVTKKRGVIAGFKEAMGNSRLLAELDTRERLDMKTWQQAGRDAAPRTYPRDPYGPASVPTTGTIVNEQAGKKSASDFG